ncbi:type II 3-dehydroquinate dehydratase [Streptomyces poriferorum]|uniref:3-dehydroquinate dehydratase n=1 Tax=Streptomyces poriferorum TaxID=2798799 RepID=A0ABY9J1N0_9ACTN|nr:MULTISPECIES: type II 3-dehydroquinate dehydratase [unclassified Streptomyces]MDP5316966.1 type II 3-dehydroquinate dehydratase [Streptomyces sp. Alt4]WLQ61598.1 type II 3-dehydroquinate dehydratase [Streptomyces sp. Alt2]
MERTSVRVIGRVLVLNGPNPNLLGTREPALYGSDTLGDVEKVCHETAAAHGLKADCGQSDHEGGLVDAIHEARTEFTGTAINPGACSHTSVAIRDALAAVERPVVEVHLTNIHRREEFRHHSHVSGVADAVICGAGTDGYVFALTRPARLIGEGAR